jgi:hypothetical protein
MKPNSIKTLIVMESDNIQYTHQLEPILKIARVIYSNNLVGKAGAIFPLPLGLERQCYRSAGVLKDFKLPVSRELAKDDFNDLLLARTKMKYLKLVYN